MGMGNSRGQRLECHGAGAHCGLLTNGVYAPCVGGVRADVRPPLGSPVLIPVPSSFRREGRIQVYSYSES